MRAGDTPLPPVLENLSQQWTHEGQEITVNLTARAMRGATLTITGNNLPAGAVLTDNHNGTAELKWTPAADTAGTYTMTITVTEGTAPDPTQTASDILVITVLA